MVLSDWLKEIEFTLVQGSLDAEVEEVAYDSRKAVKGAVFVCMKGTKADSHQFCPQAYQAG